MKKFMLVVLLVTAAVFCSGTFGTQYAVENRTHSVRIGETLWDIGCYYLPQQDGTKDVWELIFNIRKANNINANTTVLLPGQKLVIPLEIKKSKSPCI